MANGVLFNVEGQAETHDDTNGRNGVEAVQHQTQSSDKATKEKSGTKVTTMNLKRLLLKQENKCALSGIELTVENIELDHIIPLADGGSHSMENVQLVCREINRMKGVLSDARFVELCKKVAWRERGEVGELQGTWKR